MEDEHSSGHSSIPGAEFPGAVYRTIVIHSLGFWPLRGLRLAAPLERIST